MVINKLLIYVINFINLNKFNTHQNIKELRNHLKKEGKMKEMNKGEGNRQREKWTKERERENFKFFLVITLSKFGIYGNRFSFFNLFIFDLFFDYCVLILFYLGSAVSLKFSITLKW